MCRRAKVFYLSQPEIEPRLLDLQASSLPRHCKSRLLAQGSRSVLCDTLPHQIGLRPLKFQAIENHFKWDSGNYWLGLGWVIYGCAIVKGWKTFTCPSRESNPGCWIYMKTLYYVSLKAGFCPRPKKCIIYLARWHSPSRRQNERWYKHITWLDFVYPLAFENRYWLKPFFQK